MDELDEAVDFSPPVDDPVAFQAPNRTREVPIPRFSLPGEPGGYSLPPAPIGEQSTEPLPVQVPVKFWFRTRRISALGLTCSPIFPHILQLQIQPSAVSRLLARLVGLLPNFAQRAVYRILPEWFIPDHVILKSQKPRTQDLDEGDARELFETEWKAYNRLRPLQGAVIPRCYGRCRHNGTNALLLERLQGVSLGSPEGATLRLEQLSRLLDPCYRALYSFGVDHNDPNPGNFQLLDGKLRVLDLEHVEFDVPAEEQDLFLKLKIGDVLDRYRWLQAGFRAQGRLVAA